MLNTSSFFNIMKKNLIHSESINPGLHASVQCLCLCMRRSRLRQKCFFKLENCHWTIYTDWPLCDCITYNYSKHCIRFCFAIWMIYIYIFYLITSFWMKVVSCTLYTFSCRSTKWSKKDINLFELKPVTYIITILCAVYAFCKLCYVFSIHT